MDLSVEEDTSTQSGSLLVIVLDSSPGQRILSENENVLSQCLDAVMVFCNLHLMKSPQNQLAVIACYSQNSDFLYPTSNPDQKHDSKTNDGRYELFANVNQAIRDNIKNFILNKSQGVVCSESLMAGALCKALCYINRIEKQHQIGQNISSRILIITPCNDYKSQYMNFMNVFFTAQKQNVVIDACMLDGDSGLVQQGCDLTHGIYLKIPHLSGFLQYLLWLYLPEPHLRKYLALPPPVKVDFRAACFCHRDLIEIGYVCSVCLSIFCNFSPICSTCQTVFKFLGPPAKKKKNK
uniref:General transcription factor IIH subunit 3 n=1 Tax=Strigamia maritima TaxID=126957 RepID=T1J6K6_STRMM